MIRATNHLYESEFIQAGRGRGLRSLSSAIQGCERVLDEAVILDSMVRQSFTVFEGALAGNAEFVAGLLERS
jgi:hypothetical protein